MGFRTRLKKPHFDLQPNEHKYDGASHVANMTGSDFIYRSTREVGGGKIKIFSEVEIVREKPCLRPCTG